MGQPATEPRELVAVWRARAELFREHGAEQAAATIEVLAAELEAVVRADNEKPLTLTEAARLSGLAVDTIGRLVRTGRLRNVGRKFAPRVLRGELPKRSPKLENDVAVGRDTGYDPSADARSLRERRLHRGGARGTT